MKTLKSLGWVQGEERKSCFVISHSCTRLYAHFVRLSRDLMQS